MPAIRNEDVTERPVTSFQSNPHFRLVQSDGLRLSSENLVKNLTPRLRGLCQRKNECRSSRLVGRQVGPEPTLTPAPLTRPFPLPSALPPAPPQPRPPPI